MTPEATPTGAHSAGSEVTPAQLLDAIVSIVFCSPFKMSLMLQLPPARALVRGADVAAAASNAALIVTAIRRRVAMEQP
ncbi:MAG: hypothetical protein ABSE67_19025 [Xanthobacteraceae bacterium]